MAGEHTGLGLAARVSIRGKSEPGGLIVLHRAITHFYSKTGTVTARVVSDNDGRYVLVTGLQEGSMKSFEERGVKNLPFGIKINYIPPEEAQQAKVDEEFQQLATEIESLETRLAKASAENDRLKREKEGLEKSASQLGSSYAELEKRTAALQDESGRAGRLAKLWEKKAKKGGRSYHELMLDSLADSAKPVSELVFTVGERLANPGTSLEAMLQSVNSLLPESMRVESAGRLTEVVNQYVTKPDLNAVMEAAFDELHPEAKKASQQALEYLAILGSLGKKDKAFFGGEKQVNATIEATRNAMKEYKLKKAAFVENAPLILSNLRRELRKRDELVRTGFELREKTGVQGILVYVTVRQSNGNYVLSIHTPSKDKNTILADALFQKQVSEEKAPDLAKLASRTTESGLVADELRLPKSAHSLPEIRNIRDIVESIIRESYARTALPTMGVKLTLEISDHLSYPVEMRAPQLTLAGIEAAQSPQAVPTPPAKPEYRSWREMPYKDRFILFGDAVRKEATRLGRAGGFLKTAEIDQAFRREAGAEVSRESIVHLRNMYIRKGLLVARGENNRLMEYALSNSSPQPDASDIPQQPADSDTSPQPDAQKSGSFKDRPYKQRRDIIGRILREEPARLGRTDGFLTSREVQEAIKSVTGLHAGSVEVGIVLRSYVNAGQAYTAGKHNRSLRYALRQEVPLPAISP